MPGFARRKLSLAIGYSWNIPNLLITGGEADVMPAGSVVVSVEEFIVVATEAPGAGVAELGGLLVTVFLVSFQFMGVAEASYVADLHFLTAINLGRATGNWRIGFGMTLGRGFRRLLRVLATHLLPGSNSLAAFRGSDGLHGSKPSDGGLQ